ncbi:MULTISPECIES: ester cyclase [unclassified Gordonia (in: high G+C Gram-positive bacteria)]
MNTSEATDVALRSLVDIGAGTRESFDAHIHPDATNREAHQEPPECRGRGPEAFWATALWLRAAFPDVTHEAHEVVAHDDLVVVHATMSGTHRGPFVVYDDAGNVERAFAPTGRTFTVTQTHWFRIRDGLCVEHWANRDDQGMAGQLGWIPPSPAYLLRCALATRRARATAR